MGGVLGEMGFVVLVWGRVVLWSGIDYVVRLLPGVEVHRNGGDLGEHEVVFLCCCLVASCVVDVVGESVHVPTISVSACCVLLGL